jgi:hypothetical protein
MAKKGNKRAKTRAQPVPARRPKTAPQAAQSSQDSKPLFSFRYADRASKATYGFKPAGDDATALLDFMCDMAQSTWAEIEGMRTGGRKRHKKHHDQPIDSLAKNAQDHIGKHRLDEMFGDAIFRFRVSGETRLWGFRARRIFYVVWWDSKHHVCPTEKN